MQVISKKVLVDIPLFSKPTGNEKIIFQRKKDFSLESLSLIIKKLFFGKQMKQAAAVRIQTMCDEIGYREESIQQLDKHINATGSADVNQVIKTFTALSKENRRTLFLEEKNNVNPLNLPSELNDLIFKELESEAKAEYDYYLQKFSFKKETILDILSLVSSIDGSENEEINTYIIDLFYPDQKEYKGSENFAKLNEAASKILLDLADKIREKEDASKMLLDLADKIREKENASKMVLDPADKIREKEDASKMLLDLADKIREKENGGHSSYALLTKACIDEIAYKLKNSNKLYPIKNNVLNNWKNLK